MHYVIYKCNFLNILWYLGNFILYDYLWKSHEKQLSLQPDSSSWLHEVPTIWYRIPNDTNHYVWTFRHHSDQIRSVAQSCPTLCDPMYHSMPGLPVHHQLPEFTQTHVHRVSDAIQPSHPLSSPSPPAPNPSQNKSFPMSQLFARGGQSTGVSAVASFLSKKSQGWSPSEWTGWISLHSKGLSRVFSNTTVQKHQFFGTQPSSQSNSHIHI